ncbi:methyltransferase family protein [Candidatus Latescibacterota bacterium]
MSLHNKWIELLYRVAIGRKKVRILLTPVGALVFFAFIALFILLSHLLDDVLKLTGTFPRPYNFAVSIPILVVGVLLILWCNIHFLMAKGTPVPLNPPQRLVVSGPYAFTRNPMLTGLFAVLFGIGILISSISLMFIFTPLFILLNLIELKYIEEPELEKRLGEPYMDYKKRIPMFIPRFKAKRFK